MATEGVWPKTSEDIFYASEANHIHYSGLDAIGSTASNLVIINENTGSIADNTGSIVAYKSIQTTISGAGYSNTLNIVKNTGSIVDNIGSINNLIGSDVIRLGSINLNTTHRLDNTQAHTDYLLNSAGDSGVGLYLTQHNDTADQPYVPMFLYGTDATPPSFHLSPSGTIYVEYTA